MPFKERGLLLLNVFWTSCLRTNIRKSFNATSHFIWKFSVMSYLCEDFRFNCNLLTEKKHSWRIHTCSLPRAAEIFLSKERWGLTAITTPSIAYENIHILNSFNPADVWSAHDDDHICKHRNPWSPLVCPSLLLDITSYQSYSSFDISAFWMMQLTYH